MRRLHKNVMGLGMVTIVAVIGVVVAVGFAGWLVYQRQTIKSYEQCVRSGGMVYETYPPTCKIHDRTFTQPAVTSNVTPAEYVDETMIRADKSLELPTNWRQIEGTDDRLTFGGGSNECAITASVLADAKAKRTNADSYTQELFKGETDRLTSKSYAITKLAPGGIKVDGGDGAATYTTLELQTMQHGQVHRETYAYVVGDGKVGRIEMYCRGNDYTGGQTDNDKVTDGQVLQGIILPALHFKVLS